MRDPDVSVSTVVRRSAPDVWMAVADPARVVSWSPESSGVSGGQPGPLPVGTSFSGSNRNGVFRWTTQCRVVESDPGTAFAFDVTFGRLAVSRWRYVLEDRDDGCVVTEQWWDQRGLFMKAIGLVGTGVADRATHNKRTMRETLAALRADLESMPG